MPTRGISNLKESVESYILALVFPKFVVCQVVFGEREGESRVKGGEMKVEEMEDEGRRGMWARIKRRRGRGAGLEVAVDVIVKKRKSEKGRKDRMEGIGIGED